MSTAAARMRKELAILVVGLALVACGEPSTTGAETDAAPRGLLLTVRYVAEEVSRDSNSEEIQITLDGFALTYRQTRSGFGAENADDVKTTVKLSADEVDLVEAWIAEGRVMEIASVDDGAQVDPGPYHRLTIDVGIEHHGEKHEFSLSGIESARGSPTAFGQREDLGQAELLVTRLTDLVRAKRPQLFESKS